MDFKQSIKLLNKISQKKQESFYDVHKRLFNQIINYKEPQRSKTPSGVLDSLLKSYRLEFAKNISNFLKTNVFNLKNVSDETKSNLVYSLHSFVPLALINEKFRYVVTIKAIYDFINEETQRVNSLFTQISNTEFEDLDIKALLKLFRPEVDLYLNHIRSLADYDNKKVVNTKLPKTVEDVSEDVKSDSLKTAFNINLKKAMSLYQEALNHYKRLGMKEYKELNKERDKIFVIKDKGFDVDNELIGIINYLTELNKVLSNQ
jgi:hypothetical protein